MRPAYGEYGGLAGKASFADVSSSVPTSVMGCSAANVGRAMPAKHDINVIRNGWFISFVVTIRILGFVELELSSS